MPVQETVLAELCGLGWKGKHSLLLDRKRGSAFHLGGILLSLDGVDRRLLAMLQDDAPPTRGGSLPALLASLVALFPVAGCTLLSMRAAFVMAYAPWPFSIVPMPVKHPLTILMLLLL